MTHFSVVISVIVAQRSGGINSACIFIWRWRKIFALCQDFVYLSLPAMAAFLLTVDLVEPASCQELSSLISSTGTWHSCLSCAISYAAGAARSSPALILFLSVFSLHPLSIVSLYLSTQPALHFVAIIHFFSCLYVSCSHISSSESLFKLMFSRWALILFVWIVSLLTLTQALFLFFFFFFLSYRCKEGYHGLRCDQFVPKTDAILSDPSTLPPRVSLSFVFLSQSWCIDLQQENKFRTGKSCMPWANF